MNKPLYGYSRSGAPVHNANKNWSCDNDKCTSPDGEVKVYPLGSGGNLILCHACWTHENLYRYKRGLATGEQANWPRYDWAAAETYRPGNDERSN